MKEQADWSLKMAKVQVESVPEVLRKIREISRSHCIRIVCMNATMMAGRSHAEEAIRQALLAEKEGTMTARSLEMEVLLYASGQRQTSLAMNFGLHEGEMTTWIGLIPHSGEVWGELAEFMTIINDEEEIPPDRILLLQELFGITDKEIETVGTRRINELVIERTALLNVLK
ncbi:MAG: KEOPS complex subunit Cgi121 [Methanocalculus sp.]|uniref:KEOPS complex subunit Cgi121 n=1 Tax=Methanocalculus sp. TaxID=2004547 RepID=UPI00271AD75E|nr:KEOPS complex subunit Cgi121 [Methanocalculus sp.]MDO9539228.1 KEOPS complex subunit Cgi121 [Methanocalculus sp.]